MWRFVQRLLAVPTQLMVSPRTRDGSTVFFHYKTAEADFIVQARAIRRAGLRTYALVAFWPHEDHAHHFDSHGSIGSTPERYVRECFDGSPEILASLLETRVLRRLS